MPKPCREGEGSPGVGVEGKRERCTTTTYIHGEGEGEEEVWRTKGETACAVKVDYILLSRVATCCTLGPLGLPGKSNHR